MGLEYLHTWNSIITLNEQTGIPRIEIDRITGLWSLPEADDNRAPRTAQDGEIVYPSFRRGKTITYTGRVIAATALSLRALQMGFLGAFGERSDEGTMVMSHSGAPSYYYIARVLALDMDEEQTFSQDSVPSPFQRGFDLSLRMSHPDLLPL